MRKKTIKRRRIGGEGHSFFLALKKGRYGYSYRREENIFGYGLLVGAQGLLVSH